MNPLKQFDDRFGINHDQQQIEQMFVNGVETAIFEQLQWDKYIGANYHLFFSDFCIAMGLNKEDYRREQSGNYKQLKEITKSDFVQTLRVLVATNFVLKKKNKLATEKLNEDIQSLIQNLPAPINIRWHEGNFYRDDIPELSEYLIDETLNWLSEYPAARIDLQHALQNYSKGQISGILDNVYKALENVAQRVSGVSAFLHDQALLSALSKNFHLDDYWKSQFNRFIVYANEIGRHGRNETRQDASKEEVEAFLFVAIILIRMVVRKKQSLLSQPITNEFLKLYLKTSDRIKRIEQEVAKAFPHFPIYEEEENYERLSHMELRSTKYLNWKTIQEIEDSFTKYERRLIVFQQKEAEDWQDNSGIWRGMALNWLTHFLKTEDRA
jgi:hypothetical protein